MGKSILRLYNHEMKKLLAAMFLALLMAGCSEQVDFVKSNIGVLAFLFVGSCICWYFFKSSRNCKRVFDMMESTRTSAIAQIQSGPTEVRGRVKAKGEPLVSPWGKRKCVYYKFEVIRFKGSGADEHQITYVDDERSVPFLVQDDSGEVAVESIEARFQLHQDKGAHSATGDNPSEKLKQLLKTRYGKNTKGWIFNKDLHYSETSLELDGQIYVFGDAVRENTSQDGGYLMCKGEMPLIVTDKGDATIEESFKNKAMRNAVICGVLTSIWIIGGLFLLLT
jgi:hypothetical protein